MGWNNALHILVLSFERPFSGEKDRKEDCVETEKRKISAPDGNRILVVHVSSYHTIKRTALDRNYKTKLNSVA
jgi:hypothetical protein